MFSRFCIVLLIAASAFMSAHATLVRPLALDEMAASAATIFHGKCTANKTEREPGTKFIVTYTTFAVTEAMKGSVERTHVIKQIGGTLPNGDGMHVEGVPTFTVGEDYVVFLNGVSTLGFSSPTGLSQGRFNIEMGEDGPRATNGRDFREMAEPIPARNLPKALKTAPTARVNHLNLDEFKGMVRGLSGVQP